MRWVVQLKSINNQLRRGYKMIKVLIDTKKKNRNQEAKSQPLPLTNTS
jgi:hypothetical protein